MKTTIELKGIDLEVEYHYQPAEPETRTDPGCVDSFKVESVKLKDSDIDLLPLLYSDEIEEIVRFKN